MDSNHLGNSFQIESHTMYISQQNDTFKPSSIIEGQKSVQSNYRNSVHDQTKDPGSPRNSFTNFKSPRGANSRENSSDIKLASPYNPIKQSFPEAYSNLISVLDSLHHPNKEEAINCASENRESKAIESEAKPRKSTRKQFNPYYQGNEGDVSMSCTLRSHQSLKSPANAESQPREIDTSAHLPSQKVEEPFSSTSSRNFQAKFFSLGFKKLQRICDKPLKHLFFDALKRRIRIEMFSVSLAELVRERIKESMKMIADFYPLHTFKPKVHCQSDRADKVILQKAFRGLREATKRQRALIENLRSATILEKAFGAWRCLSTARTQRNAFKASQHNKARLKAKSLYTLKSAVQLTASNIKELLTLRLSHYWSRFKSNIEQVAVDRTRDKKAMKFRVASLKKRALQALIKQAAERKWHSKDGYVRLKVTRTYREYYEPATLKLTSRQRLATVIRPVLFDN